jgi:hypothetical protein
LKMSSRAEDIAQSGPESTAQAELA